MNVNTYTYRGLVEAAYNPEDFKLVFKEETKNDVAIRKTFLRFGLNVGLMLQ